MLITAARGRGGPALGRQELQGQAAKIKRLLALDVTPARGVYPPPGYGPVQGHSQVCGAPGRGRGATDGRPDKG